MPGHGSRWYQDSRRDDRRLRSSQACAAGRQRAYVPAGDFRVGDMFALPFADDRHDQFAETMHEAMRPLYTEGLGVRIISEFGWVIGQVPGG